MNQIYKALGELHDRYQQGSGDWLDGKLNLEVLKALAARVDALEKRQQSRTIERSDDFSYEGALQSYEECLDNITGVPRIPGSGSEGCRKPHEIRVAVQWLMANAHWREAAFLVDKWRAQADQLARDFPGHFKPEERAETLRHCADQLAALLPPLPGAKEGT